MITFKAKDFYYTNGKDRVEGECLSTDTKPTEGIANGSCLIEMDTNKAYMFDEAGETWRNLSSSGGGGSSLPAVTSDDNGDVLTVVDGAWDKASPSGGGNFVVNFSTQDYKTFTADKTFAQIKSAIASGQNVVGSAMGYIMSAVQYAEGESIIFSAVVPTSATAISAITMTMDYTDSITPMETAISQG